MPVERIRTKETAEATLRELPSVIGAFVREDIYGHPREVHLLVKAGPNVRHLARDVRELLEERLQVPVDQRIISIAQVSGDVPAPSGSPAEPPPALTGSMPVEEEVAGEPRLLFGGLESMFRDARVVVRVRLTWQAQEFEGEGAELDAGSGRVRAAATAALRAAAAAARDTVRLELEGAAQIRAFERDYVLVSALATAPNLGRRPLTLAAAHQSEDDPATAAALAALKAVNRVVALRLRGRPGDG